MADTTGALSAAPITITMKLLVGHQAAAAARGKFAEAGKDAVDFLFSSSPHGRHGREAAGEGVHGRQRRQPLLQRGAARGSYLRPGFGKDALLCPAVEASPLLRLPALPAPAPRTFFTCGTTNQFNYQGCRGYVSDARGAQCPACGNEIATQSQYEAAPAPAQKEQGVQGGVTYTVTDDLAVTPMSAILQHRAARRPRRRRSPAALQERTVQLGTRRVWRSSRVAAVQDCAHRRLPRHRRQEAPVVKSSKNGGTRYECLTWRFDVRAASSMVQS
ncbi:hypothetical protein ZWY2020_015282 [Hordeum vulgare]|nr:hypothetical protein ZWY2020_015282 [Hordeum vulgare]